MAGGGDGAVEGMDPARPQVRLGGGHDRNMDCPLSNQTGTCKDHQVRPQHEEETYLDGPEVKTLSQSV